MTSVLIVDDEPLLASAYEISLTRAGYKVWATTVPADGLAIVKKERPDVILLDMLMPEMNGVQFLQAMAEAKISRSRVVALSNIESPDLVKATQKLGVARYVLKVNYTPRELAGLVKEIAGN